MAQSGWRAFDKGLVDDVSSLPTTMAPVKSEDNENEAQPGLYSSYLYQTQTESNTEAKALIRNPTEQIKTEPEDYCGGPQLTSDPDPNTSLQPNGDRKASGSQQIKHLETKIEDDDKDWNDIRAHGSAVNSDGEWNTAIKAPSSESGEEFDSQRSHQRDLTKMSFSKYLNTFQNVNEQKRVHSGKTNARCIICGQICLHRRNLRVHMRVHTGDKPFTCDECGQRLSNKGCLTRHMRVHTGDKPFSCDACGQRFSENVHLNQHMRIHTGEKPFSCKECGHRFSQMTNLIKHMKIHTRHKPFCCDECGKRFNRKTHLTQHMRIHTGDKPFCCDECGKGFSVKTYLNRHVKIHTRAGPFI